MLDPPTDSDKSAEKLLSIWMERAWRRSISTEERKPFLELYRNLRAQDMSFDDALRASFQSVLMSGPFRYHASPDDKDAERAQLAIASRLSFMLNGGPPSRRHRDLAKGGKLKDAAEFDAQVDLLLHDPASEAFFEPFVTQWLELSLIHI